MSAFIEVPRLLFLLTITDSFYDTELDSMYTVAIKYPNSEFTQAYSVRIRLGNSYKTNHLRHLPA
jgi:hypothetical protein